ncbi:hypothetical protein [Bradyrhizobium sp. UFLA05-112]
MKLSIRCWAGRTELLLNPVSTHGRGEDYVISLRLNNDQPIQIPTVGPANGPSITLAGDVVHLLQSLPDTGELTVYLTARTGISQRAMFALAGLEKVRRKMVTVCKWPQAVAKPRT